MLGGKLARPLGPPPYLKNLRWIADGHVTEVLDVVNILQRDGVVSLGIQAA